MSTAGFGNIPVVWCVEKYGDIFTSKVSFSLKNVRPVLILKADTLVTGTGTSTDPYVVQS